MAEWQQRPQRLVSAFIKKQLRLERVDVNNVIHSMSSSPGRLSYVTSYEDNNSTNNGGKNGGRMSSSGSTGSISSNVLYANTS